MSEKMGKHTEKLFTDQDLVVAAGRVRQSMLDALPEPEACTHEFSPEFQTKMERLFTKEKVRTALDTVRRYAAAIILLILFSAGAVLAVDAEARANFFDWVRKLYENSIVYEFFGGTPEEGLPTYELGWVPEGYEEVYEYCDEIGYSAIYQKSEDETAVFVFDYYIRQEGGIYEAVFDKEKYEIVQVKINGRKGELYIALDEAETNHLVWVDEARGIIFSINGYLEEEDIMHIAEELILCKTPK